MQKSSRKLLVVLIGLLLLSVVVYLSGGFLRHQNFSWGKLLHALRGANPLLLVLSLVGIYACYALRSLRWQVFQSNLGPSHFWEIYKITLAGFSAMFLLGRLGELVRPVLLARKEKLPVADMFGIYALERVLDIASMVVIAAAAMLLFKSNPYVVGATRTTGSVLVLGVIGGIAFLVYARLHGSALLERRLQNWLGARGWRVRIARILIGFARGVQMIQTWGQLARAVAYSAIHWFLVLLVYFWVSRSFGGRLGTISLSEVTLVMAFTLVGSIVQLPAVGGGSQLASILALTTIVGVEKEPATAAAIVLYLVTFAACSLVGAPLLAHEGLSLGKLRELAKHEKEAAVESAAQQGDSAP
jgi:glycosyltransferase 2 family protein